MRYRALIADHDDTVVNSTATVHYPCFVEYTEKYFPHYQCSLEEYFLKNFDPGVVPFFRDIVGMNEEQMVHEQKYWHEYVQDHVPGVYEGMREILTEYKKQGGLICVVSHSYKENILRDYREGKLPEPDMVFGWEYPPEQRKPSPYPVLTFMEEYGLDRKEVLILDDLKPGYDMAVAAGVDFAAAGWANDIPEIETFMRKNSKYYFKTVDGFGRFLLG